MTLTSDVIRYSPIVCGERKPVTYTGETPGNWIRSSVMFEFLMWVMFQVVTTMLLFKWYARMHPVEAAMMVEKWKGMFSKS